MNAPELNLRLTPPRAAAPTFLDQWTSYWIDAAQRGVLFLDILRERANKMLAHEQTGLPPLLHFEYETILDARRFKHPATSCRLHEPEERQAA